MNQITNNIRKRVRSLSTLKGRRNEGCFVVEGNKSVLELLPTFDLRGLFASQQWLDNHRDITVPAALLYKATSADLERMTALSTPSEVLAVFAIPVYEEPVIEPNQLYIALDSIADPGNLGTIVRLADWFGVKHIFAGHGTVDIFNPKTVMSTMGSVGRVAVHYVDLPVFLKRCAQSGLPIWGTFLDGQSLYDLTENSPTYGVIVMGNEGHGISSEVSNLVSHRLFIPPYPPDRHGAESLNVAVATAVTLAEFRRRTVANF